MIKHHSLLTTTSFILALFYQFYQGLERTFIRGDRFAFFLADNQATYSMNKTNEGCLVFLKRVSSKHQKHLLWWCVAEGNVLHDQKY